MVGAIMSKRAWPIYGQFLNKKGASNLAEQKAILRPVIKLFKEYEIVILGDREFHSVDFAKWLTRKKVYFVLRQKKNTNIQIKGQDYYRLDALKIAQGSQLFLRNIKITKKWQVNQISMGVYWKSAPPALRFPQRIGRSKKKIQRNGRERTLVLTNEFTEFSRGSQSLSKKSRD